MARRAFYSFHYAKDAWRAAQIRSIGAVDGNKPVTDNVWEEVKRGGDRAIKLWIDNQLEGRSVTIVLIGTETAGRKWINYEISESWNKGKGLLGVFIHNVRDENRRTTRKGANPFAGLRVGTTPLSAIVNAYDPPYTASTSVYNYIRTNLQTWVEQAVRFRNQYR